MDFLVRGASKMWHHRDDRPRRRRGRPWRCLAARTSHWGKRSRANITRMAWTMARWAIGLVMVVIPFFHGIRSGYLPENTGDLAGCVGYTLVSPVQVWWCWLNNQGIPGLFLTSYEHGFRWDKLRGLVVTRVLNNLPLGDRLKSFRPDQWGRYIWMNTGMLGFGKSSTDGLISAILTLVNCCILLLLFFFAYDI